MLSKQIELNDVDPLALLGSHDEFLRLVDQSFNTKIVVRDNRIFLSGEPADVDAVEQVFSEMVFILNRNGKLGKEEVKTIIDLTQVENGIEKNNSPDLLKIVYTGKRGRQHLPVTA